MANLFLSHAYGDRELAGALKRLIESCSGGQIKVNGFSSSPSEGGIPSGSEWLSWVNEQVRDSKFAVILLTPRSIDKPWLMWEAGAVSGVSLAKGESFAIIPVVYRLSMEDVPSPLRSRQATLGQDGESVRNMLETLKQSTTLSDSTFNEYVKLFVPRYLDTVAKALAETPPPLTESAVQDWLDRITYLERTDRRSEIAQLHRDMVNVFALGNALDIPLDVRWHRRLGDIYLFSKQSKKALAQYDLALRLSPRDVFMMHKKALAFLECGNEQGAEETLDQLLQIDPRAAVESTEIAGLKGRLYWQKYQRSRSEEDLRTSRDAYAAGLEFNVDSHYMADNVGQLSLLLGDTKSARQAFEAGLDALKRTGDRGYWAFATKASCYFGLGNRDEGLAALQQIIALRPEPAVLGSIRRGLERLSQGLGGTKEELESWFQVISGT